MTQAEKIQAVISEAEQKIATIIEELNLKHNIGVGAICYGEDLEPGTVDLRTFRVNGAAEELTKYNSTLGKWGEQLQIECAYKNMPLDFCGGYDEMKQAYDEGSTPLDLLQECFDAA